MELVYLWVEEYKNIREQGFNFSPRFECNYDGKELTICDKKKKECKDNDYIENFFGDNINVTAIVGKNGSGKSNIFESLLSNLMYSSGIPIDANYKVLSFFYNKEDEKVYYKDLNSNFRPILNRERNSDISSLISNKYEIEKENMPFTFHYNYSLDWINNNENNLDFDKLYHKNDNYKTPILMQPNKSNRKISISNIDYIATRDILQFTIKNNINFKFINDFFIPISCNLKYRLLDISKKENIFYRKLEQMSSHIEPIEKFRIQSYYYILRKTVDKCQNHDYSFIKNTEFKSKLEEDKIEENFDDLLEFIKIKDFDELYNDNIEYMTRKIKDTFLFLDYLKNQELEDIDNFLFQGNKTIQDNKELLLNLPPWVQIEFFEKNKVSFYSLSYGQKFMIKFMYSLLNQLKNLESHKNYRDINLLLDEVEQGLHPEWQKKFLNNLISILKTKIEYNFNIICATHSPFILSDIPKENIYFLKNGENDYKFKKQTFGANIHTLLSDSFFMDKGLMGEFAKGKINKILKNLQDDEYEPNEQEKNQLLLIIESIGEPFLRSKMLDMYNRKFIDDYKDREKKKIEEQINDLNKKLKKLDND